MVSDVYFPRINGVSTSVQAITNELRRLGHEATIVAPAYGTTNDKDHSAIRVAGWRVPFDPEDRLMKPWALRHCLRSMEDGWEIVHVHTPFLAHRAGVRFAKSRGIPVVETYHTFFQDYFHNYVPFLPASLAKRIATYFTRTICREVDGIIVPSSAIREHILAVAPVPRNLRIIPTGLPPEDFRPGNGTRFRHQHHISPTTPLLLHVGRIAFEKNISFLLEAFHEILSHRGDAIFLIAGEGPALKSLKEISRRLELGNKVRFLGYLDRSTTLRDCYAAADVFLFSSKTETQGLVLLESMAQGTPVVSLAALGTQDLLKRCKGAEIAEESTIDFAARVLELLADRSHLKVLGEQAKGCAEQWSSATMGREVVDFYHSALQRTTSREPCARNIL